MVRSDGHPRMKSLSDNHELNGEEAAGMTDSHQLGQTVVEVSVYPARQRNHRLASNMSLSPMEWHGGMTETRGVYSVGPRWDHVGLTARNLPQRRGWRSSSQGHVRRSAALWTRLMGLFLEEVL